MKVFALLFLVGCSLASMPSEWRWQSGKEHVFEYSGRLLTGFPHLSSHYSGLGINATVVVQVLGPEKLQLYVENPKYVRVNQKLQSHTSSMDGPDGSNWRELHLPEMTPVDQPTQALLQKPIQVSFVSGEVQYVKVSPQEPEWSVNFKKALVLLLQTKVDTSAWNTDSNQILSPLSEGLNYWKVKEQSIDGICENTYQINELPKYMVRDQPYLIPRPEACPQDQYYEIVKVRNIDTCEKRSAFTFYKPGQFRCSGPNCKNMWSRSTETRYIACGSRGGNGLVIQSIFNNWELTNQMYMGFKSEPLVSGNLQVLQLKEVRPVSPKPLPSDAVELESLLYEYSSKNYEQPQHNKDAPRVPPSVLQNPEELAKTLPRNFLQGQLSKKVNKPKIISQIKQLLPEIVQEMENPIQYQAGDKQVTMKILSVARGLSILSKQEIQQLYTELQSSVQPKQVLKDLFYDAVLMAGTPESVIFLKEKIVGGEIPMYRALSLFVMLPHSLVIPTEPVLEELLQLVQSHWVQECPITKRIAQMSYTTLLYRACLSTNRHTAYPTDVLGKLCQPESPVVMQKWIPHLLEQLESTSTPWSVKNDLIVNIGQLPSRTVVAKLIPFVEGKYPTPVPGMTRILALWSLVTAGKEVEPQVISPIVQSIYANPAEPTEMRITAFNGLLKLNPPMAVFHKIAARTWTEQDTEVLKVVNMALFTLQLQHQQPNEPQTEYTSLASKAYLTYPLIKKIHGFYPTSTSIYTADYLPKLGVGYEGMTSWIASNSSYLPLEVYFKLKYFLSQYEFQPIAFGVRMEGSENVYRKLAELLMPLRNGKSAVQLREEMVRQMRESLHSEWRKVIDKLQIEPRDSQKISGSFYLSAFETTPLFLNFEEVTLDYIKEQFLRDPRTLKDKVNGQTPFKYQKMLNMAPLQMLVPSEMGFPVIMEVHMPTAFSVKGHVELNLNAARPSVQLKAKTFLTSQYVGWVGTTIPFTQEYAVTVIDQTKTYNLPAVIELNVDVPSHHLHASIKADTQISKPIDILHFQTLPYTSVKKVEDLTPLSTQKKLIESGEPLKPMNFPFGESLGLHFTSQWLTEAPYTDIRGILDKLAMFNYNPLSVVKFNWVPFSINRYSQVSVRRNIYKIIFDPSQSSTKKFNVDIMIGYATKVNKFSPYVYQKVELTKSDVPAVYPVYRAFQELYPVSVRNQSVEMMSIHPERQRDIVKAITPLKDMETGQAMTIKFVASIPQPRFTWTYVATIASGQQPMPSEKTYTSRWNVILESKKTGSKIEVAGKLAFPILPIWSEDEIRSSQNDFRYHNSIKVLPQGQQPWSVDVNGVAKTSHEQKEYSRISPEAKTCLKDKSEKSTLGKLSRACELVRQQAGALDEVDFSIKYNNVPKYLEQYEELAFQQVKALLWPFLGVDSMTPVIKPIGEHPTSVRVLFHQTKPSVDILIRRPQEQITYKNVRVPYPLALLLPLKSTTSDLKVADRKVLGYNLYPVCKVSGQTLKTYDNKTLPFHIDYCFHLMSADCSSQHKFGILTRVMRPGNRREMKVFLDKHVILMTPAQRQSTHSYFPSIKVTIDQEEMTLIPNNSTEVRSPYSDGRLLGSIFRSPNNVLRLQAPEYGLDLTYDGDDFTIETSQYDKSKLCGLCGNQNQQPRDDIEGPRKCLYSEPKVEIASYRVRDSPSSCDQEKPLPLNIKQKLINEDSQCVKFSLIPTKITKSLRTQVGECTIVKHAIIRRPGEVCISKRPVVDCASGCKVADNTLLEKVMPFACLVEDRVAEHYVKKVEQGQRLPEIEARPTAFETRLPQPRSCVAATNEL